MGTEALPIPEALRARLRTEPTDRESWLVFADWLTDRGDPRGQLITLEDRIEYGKLPRKQHHALRLEHGERLQAGRGEWLQGWVPPDDAVLDWHGGFVVGVTLYGGRAVRAFESLIEHPAGQLLASATLQHTRGRWQRLSSPAFGGLSSLRILRSENTVEVARALVAFPHFGSLRMLALTGSGGRIESEAARLAAAAHLGNLHSLDLSGNYIGADGAALLAASPHLGSLRSLRLGGNQLGERGAVALGSGALRALCVLDLSGNTLGDGGLAALIDAGPWPALTWLNLNYNGIGRAGAVQLARSDAFEALERLSVCQNRIQVAGARALVTSSGLRSLKELDLRSNNIRASSLDTLRQSGLPTGRRILL